VTYRLALFGAPPDTPNMGVSALFASAVEGLTRALGDVEWVVFDNGLGRRSDHLELADGSSIPLLRLGARVGRRYYRPENLATMQWVARFGPLGRYLNEALRRIDACDAVLDVSGGDSFSDIYGWNRFNAVYWTKQVALLRGVPLILLPQTYGPYRDARAKQLASTAVRSTGMAWARDANSFTILQGLLGDRFDDSIHRQGVDMAFGLSARSALSRLPVRMAEWLDNSARQTPVVGINISGLIFNDPGQAQANYRFIADYRAVVAGLVARLLETSDARIMLVPHVMDQPGHYESDLEACQSIQEKFSGSFHERLVVSPIDLDQSEVKWVISRCDWFCGTRMHATIAALSSGVPTAAIAYSDKTLGVFASCGQAEQVFDPRKLDTPAMISGVLNSFVQRDSLRESLAQHLPAVRQVAQGQMAEIASFIRNLAGRKRTG
jgi:colanic acid/amylovoran biosynthesis protein